MPAKLVIASPRSSAREYAIEEELVRIGSDPSCELRLTDAEVPPHAASLEYYENAYRLYNRSESEIHLEERALGVRQSSAWRPGQTLRLKSGVTLRLETASDPRPMRRQAVFTVEVEPAPADESVSAAEATPAPATERPHGKAMKIGVIVACALVSIPLALMGPVASEEASADPSTFARLIRSLDGPAGSSADPELREVRSLLQEGRMARLRGDDARAFQAFSLARDFLLARRGMAGGDGAENAALGEESAALVYIAGHLRETRSAMGVGPD